MSPDSTHCLSYDLIIRAGYCSFTDSGGTSNTESSSFVFNKLLTFIALFIIFGVL
jgi:hypothetical protein